MSLGVAGKGLRSFEVVGGKEEGEEKWNDRGVEGEEIKKGLKTLEEAFKELDNNEKANDEGTKVKVVDERSKEEPQPAAEKKTLPPAAENHPLENQELPAAEKADPTPAPGVKKTDNTAKHSFLKTFVGTFKSDAPSLSPPPASETSTPPITTTTSSPQTQNQSETETWINIPQDPDWENVTREERKEVSRKLWKDKGEWIKVNSSQNQPQ
jgi:hypothetical protein